MLEQFVCSESGYPRNLVGMVDVSMQADLLSHAMSLKNLVS